MEEISKHQKRDAQPFHTLNKVSFRMVYEAISPINFLMILGPVSTEVPDHPLCLLLSTLNLRPP